MARLVLTATPISIPDCSRARNFGLTAWCSHVDGSNVRVPNSSRNFFLTPARERGRSPRGARPGGSGSVYSPLTSARRVGRSPRGSRTSLFCQAAAAPRQWRTKRVRPPTWRLGVTYLDKEVGHAANQRSDNVEIRKALQRFEALRTGPRTGRLS